MKVFILTAGWDYAGDRILLVSENKEFAEEQLKKHIATKEYGHYDLEEWEVLE